MSAFGRLYFPRVALFGVLACAVIVVFFRGVMQAPFNLDEIYYLNGSRAFDLWQSWDLRTLSEFETLRLYGAPLAPLLAGLSRSLADMPLGGPYSYPLGNPDPLGSAFMPMPSLLYAARLPMVMMGVSSTLLLTALLWRSRGAAAGVAVSLLLLSDAGHVTIYRELMTEPPMLFFTLLALVLSLIASRRPTVWAVAVTGMCAGLAMVSKHTAVLAVIASAATVGLSGFLARAGPGTALARSAAIVAIAALTVIALNPFSWGNPLAAAQDIIVTRQLDFEDAKRNHPTQALPTLADRIPFFVWRVFTGRAAIGCAREFARQIAVDPETDQWVYGAFEPAKPLAYTPLCQPGLGAAPVLRPLTWVNLGLFVAGIALVIMSAIRRRTWTVDLTVTAWMLLFFAVTGLTVQLTWGQYYVLPTTFATVLQAVAIGAGAQKLLGFARRRVG